MTGRLAGSLAGRPVSLLGEDDRIVVHLDGFRSAWALRRMLPARMSLVGDWMQERGVSTWVAIGNRKPVPMEWRRRRRLARLFGWMVKR